MLFRSPDDQLACRAKSYLVPGNLVFPGKAKGDLTCVSYQTTNWSNPWAVGWVPSATLAKVDTASRPTAADWLGKWKTTGAEITITRARDGRFVIKGLATLKVARDVRTGVLDAEVRPEGAMLAFADDGRPLAEAGEGDCLVRMRRLEQSLVVEDNGQCGGLGVSFTGLYRRN